MQKSIIPMFAVMCVAVTTPTQSNASTFARVGATAAIHYPRPIPCGCLWESYCAETKPICQRCRRRRHACGRGPHCGSACCKSSCAQKQTCCDAGCNTCSQRNGAGIIRSRPSTSAPQYIEPWPPGQDSFDSVEHTNGVLPTQNVLPRDHRVPQDFVPADDLPQIVLPQKTRPYDDRPTTRRRPRRLTVHQASRHTAITIPLRSRHVTKSSPPVPQSAHQSR